jgi:hypothetical protein
MVAINKMSFNGMTLIKLLMEKSQMVETTTLTMEKLVLLEVQSNSQTVASLSALNASGLTIILQAGSTSFHSSCTSQLLLDALYLTTTSMDFA